MNFSNKNYRRIKIVSIVLISESQAMRGKRIPVTGYQVPGFKFQGTADCRLRTADLYYLIVTSKKEPHTIQCRAQYLEACKLILQKLPGS